MTQKTPILRYGALSGIVLVALALTGRAAFIRHFQGSKPPLSPTRAESGDVRISTGVIGTGGSLSKSLQGAGLSALLTSQLIKALTPLFNPHTSKPEDRYHLVQSTGGELVELTYWPSPLQYFSVRVSSTVVFTATKNQVPLTHARVGVRGEIRTSLWESMRSQGVAPDLIVRFAEIFGSRIDFLTEPRKGDSYQLIWWRSEGNGAVRDDAIICAAYTSHERGELVAYAWAGEFYDAKGDSLRGEFLRAPLAYRRISSYFTERRYHPILRIYRPHHGIDYSAPYGTPASSIADGVVTLKGWGGGIGNQVRVRHAGSYVSIYGHLSRFPPGIHVGSHVKQGQIIGYVGSTGLSTGPHLHFGFEQNGKLINFFSLKLGSNRRQIARSDRASFSVFKEEAAALLTQVHAGGSVQTLVLPGDALTKAP